MGCGFCLYFRGCGFASTSEGVGFLSSSGVGSSPGGELKSPTCHTVREGGEEGQREGREGWRREERKEYKIINSKKLGDPNQGFTKGPESEGLWKYKLQEHHGGPSSV